MKGKKAVKIIIWILIAIILVSVLIVFVIGVDRTNNRGGFFGIGNSNVSGLYDNGKEYKIGSVDVSADEIKSIELNWISGAVDVKPYDGDAIQATESFVSGEQNDDNTMRYIIKDGKLTVQFTKPFSFFKRLFAKKLTKNLTLLIPKAKTDITNFDIDIVSSELQAESVTAEFFTVDNVSGNIQLRDISSQQATLDNVSGQVGITGITANHIRIDTVSGGVTLSDAVTDTFKIETVSGGISFYGAIKELSMECVSGKASYTLGAAPEKINCETVSGNITLSMPDNDGFTLGFETVTGKLTSDFAITSQGKNKSVYGNGKADYDFETVSGDVTLNLQNAE